VCSDFVRVSDGTRTRDRLDHNQRVPLSSTGARARFPSGVGPDAVAHGFRPMRLDIRRIPPVSGPISDVGPEPLGGERGSTSRVPRLCRAAIPARDGARGRRPAATTEPAQANPRLLAAIDRAGRHHENDPGSSTQPRTTELRARQQNRSSPHRRPTPPPRFTPPTTSPPPLPSPNPSGTDDVGASLTRELCRHRTDCASRAVHEDALAGAKAAVLE
jgi:hypothetical protein